MPKKRQHHHRRTSQNSSSSRARTPYQYTGFYDNANTRLDVYSVGGYPNEVAFSDLWSAYRRKGLAKVVIDLPVRTCWQTPPHIECEDAAWMKSLERLIEHHDLWERLRALDIRQRIGQYGGLWLIAKERAGAEAKGPILPMGPEGLLNLRPLFESQLDVTQWIDDIQSADYGNPKYYNYRSQVPGTKSQGDSQSFELHPSRLFIFAEGADDGSIYGIPALESCFNALMDAEKIRCAGGEGFLRNAKQRFAMEVTDQQTAATLFSNDTKRKEFDQDVDDFNKGFDNSLLLAGMKANTMQSSIADPMNHWMICMNEIAASQGIPVTILIGQMTGRLASDEDQKQLGKYKQDRCNNTLTPMLRRFFAHMAKVGLMPAPKSPIEIWWDNLVEASDSERADLTYKMAQTNEVSMRAGSGPIYTAEEIREAGGLEGSIPDIDLGGEEIDDPLVP